MMPFADATNHLSFKLDKKYINPIGSVLPLENEINAMAQMGWQLNMIAPIEDGYVLLVYVGFVDNSPTGGMEAQP